MLNEGLLCHKPFLQLYLDQGQEHSVRGGSADMYNTCGISGQEIMQLNYYSKRRFAEAELPLPLSGYALGMH